MLFRSVDLKLPPAQLGWEVGTFEFLSDTITSTFTPSSSGSGKVKLKLRTGGSSATIKREQCTKEEDGLKWDISGVTNNTRPRLPVRYRYRSPVFFEFHVSGKRHAEHFAAVWLQELGDMEEREFDVPVWRCDNSMRLSQNYVTAANCTSVPDIDIQEVGRLRFRGRFKPGTDRDHFRFVSDNDSRETIETWEACYAEGVRQEEVRAEVPPAVARLHEQSLTHGRDVLAAAPEEEKRRWLARDGTDWTGAFGADPADLIAGRKSHVSFDPEDQYVPEEESEDDASASASGSALSSPRAPRKSYGAGTDLGISDATTDPGNGGEGEGDGADGGRQGRPSTASTRSADGYVLSGATTAQSTDSSGKHSRASSLSGSGSSKNPIKAYRDYRSRSRDLHRQQRGLMQWRPMRNAQFAKDEAKFAVRRVTKMGSLSGRQPDVETEV